MTHPARPQEVFPAKELDSITCSRHKHGSENVADGVFLLHQGCKTINPFWTGKTVNVPEKVTDQSGAEIKHWIIENLRSIAKDHPDLKEMWFPEILFHAANLRDGDERVGCLVMMIGAPKTGKTVLSTMAMAPSSYGGLHVEHFVHITRSESATQSFELLRILGSIPAMQKFEGAIEPPAGTDITNVSNMKSAYFSLPHTASGKERRTVRSELKNVLANLFGNSTRELRFKERVIAFYDKAGEAFEGADGGSEIRRFSEHGDVITFFVDGRVVGPQSQNPAGPSPEDTGSVGIAVAQMNDTHRFTLARGRRCIIVTKLDQVAGDKDLEAYKQDIRDKQIHFDDPRARNFLLGWLKDKTGSRGRLYDQLVSDPSIKVFFVWTENLGSKLEQARCYGLMPFTLWCLDWRAALQTRRGA